MKIIVNITSKYISEPVLGFTSIFLFLIIVGNLFTADITAQKTNYYDAIHRAEVSLIKNEFEDASLSYKTAFETYKTDYYLKDLQNALVSAYYADDYDLFQYFNELMKLWDLDSFYIDDFVKSINLRTSSIIDISIIKDRDYCIKQSNLCSLMVKLNILDQSLRTSCKELAAGNPYLYCQNEIKLLDSLILFDMLNYIESNGFPSSKEFCCELNQRIHPFYIILLHNLMWNRMSHMELFKTQIDSLRFHPQLYAALISYMANNKIGDHNNISDNYGLGYHLINNQTDKLYILPIDDIEIRRRVEHNRSSLHLDSFDFFSKKLSYQYENPEFMLIYPSLISSINMDQTTFDAVFPKWSDYVIK